MDIQAIVKELKRERDRLTIAIVALEGTDLPPTPRESIPSCQYPRSTSQEASPPHPGGQKTYIGYDEEAVGREDERRLPGAANKLASPSRIAPLPGVPHKTLLTV